MVMAFIRRHRLTLGYAIMALGVGAALFAGYVNDRQVDQNRIERIAQLNRINLAQCKSLQNLYVVIRKTIQDGSKAIREVDYYRDHPAERERALARNRETFELFRVPPCPDEVEVPDK